MGLKSKLEIDGWGCILPAETPEEYIRRKLPEFDWKNTEFPNYWLMYSFEQERRKIILYIKTKNIRQDPPFYHKNLWNCFVGSVYFKYCDLKKEKNFTIESPKLRFTVFELLANILDDTQNNFSLRFQKIKNITFKTKSWKSSLLCLEQEIISICLKLPTPCLAPGSLSLLDNHDSGNLTLVGENNEYK